MKFKEREMDFKEADRRYAGLKRQLDAGTISIEEFDAQLKQLMIQDQQGQWWAKSRGTGEWMCHDGNAWLPGTPPDFQLGGPGYQPDTLRGQAAVGIAGAEGMDLNQLNFELSRGAKFVVFQYCISVLILSFKQSSNIYFFKSGESRMAKMLPFAAISLILGWWGIPWGPIWTIQTTVTNLSGGKDVTQEVTSLNYAER